MNSVSSWCRALRILRGGAIALAVGIHATGASALMAGDPPDSPEARIDANRPGSLFSSVGSVIAHGDPFSGVLISRRHVLTAAHVAGNDPAKVEFQLNLSAEMSQRFAVQKIFTHPNWNGFDPKRPNDDVAIMLLAEDVPANVPIYPILSTPPVPGLPLMFVGYGASGSGSAGHSVAASATVRRLGGNNADAFMTDDEGSERAEVYVYDFDGGSAPNALGGTGLGNSVETSCAPGDSGSPTFVRTPKGWALFGINTFIFSFPNGPTAATTFGTGGGGNIVGAYREWIEHVMRDDANKQSSVRPRWVTAKFKTPSNAVRSEKKGGITLK